MKMDEYSYTFQLIDVCLATQAYCSPRCWRQTDFCSYVRVMSSWYWWNMRLLRRLSSGCSKVLVEYFKIGLRLFYHGAGVALMVQPPVKIAGFVWVVHGRLNFVVVAGSWSSLFLFLAKQVTLRLLVTWLRVTQHSIWYGPHSQYNCLILVNAVRKCGVGVFQLGTALHHVESLCSTSSTMLDRVSSSVWYNLFNAHLMFWQR